jgi:hypothetical protein
MGTGYNSLSKEEAKEAILAYISLEPDEEVSNEFLKQETLEHICNLYEFELEESETEFEEQEDF